MGVEHARAVDEGIAVKPAKPCELSVLKARYAAKNAHLIGIFQLRLEAHHVVERAQLVILAQLHNGVGFDGGVVCVGETARLHRPMPQCLDALRSHDLDGKAAAEIRRGFFPFLEIGFLARKQRFDEGEVLFLVHRTVDVVLARASWPHLVVARLVPAHAEIDGVTVHDRRDRIKERQVAFTRVALNVFGQTPKG